MRLALFAKTVPVGPRQIGRCRRTDSAEAVVASAIRPSLDRLRRATSAEIAAFVADVVPIRASWASSPRWRGVSRSRAHAGQTRKRSRNGSSRATNMTCLPNASFWRRGSAASDLGLEVDEWLRDRFCANPFEEIEIRDTGNVNTCCSAWMPRAIGSVHMTEAKASGIRPSPRRCVARFSTATFPLQPSLLPEDRQANIAHAFHVGSDRFTAPAPHAADDGRSPAKTGRPVAGPFLQSVMPVLPRRGHPAGQAQARCPRYALRRAHPSAAWRAGRIKITGSGDPFGSRHFRHVLKRLTDAPRTGADASRSRPMASSSTRRPGANSAWKAMSIRSGFRSTRPRPPPTTPSGAAAISIDCSAISAFLGSMRAEGPLQSPAARFRRPGRQFPRDAGFRRLARVSEPMGFISSCCATGARFRRRSFAAATSDRPPIRGMARFVATLGHPDLAATPSPISATSRNGFRMHRTRKSCNRSGWTNGRRRPARAQSEPVAPERSSRNRSGVPPASC